MHECFQLHHGPGEPILDVDYYLSQYDAELRHTDNMMGIFLERLKTAGLYDSSLMFILGDHGAEFYEHGGFGHGHVLFEHSIHIPFVVRLPGGRGGDRRISGRVSSLDIYPTALSFAGIKAPESSSGMDLSEILSGKKGGLNQRAVFSETDYEGTQRVILSGPWKLMVSPDKTRPRGLFNLRTDAGENHSVWDDRHNKVQELMKRLIEYQDAATIQRKSLPESKNALSSKTLEELRRLGYVQ